ncbi:class II aldolase/adducin family protein [Amycolatopsis minnesotensis]|uniref:Class II aldolase/adducin family protein n=1 Tax=Amycolatopsis minnesotensis TaxID=337894 RepID=A0ABN2QMU0_9PSEU
MSDRSPDEERTYRKRRLAASMRLFARYGFDEGVGGHMTVRDPERPDRFWINPLGRHFGHVRVRDLLLVDGDGTVVAGEGRVNQAGYTIHAELHAAYPDVVSAVHTHSIHGRAWAALGRPLDPITQDACAFYRDHAVFAEYGGVVLDAEEGKRIAATLGENKAVILRNHGLLTVGGSPAEAAWWFISMERCCQVQLLAEASASEPVLIPDAEARSAWELLGTPSMGRFNFRPLYEWIVRAEPDLLE